MGLAGLPMECCICLNKRKIKGKMGRRALIVNLCFEASLAPGRSCDRGAAAATGCEGASRHPPWHRLLPSGTGLCWQKGNPAHLVPSRLSPMGQVGPRDAAQVLRCRSVSTERTENEGPIQNMPRRLERQWSSAGLQV